MFFISIKGCLLPFGLFKDTEYKSVSVKIMGLQVLLGSCMINLSFQSNYFIQKYIIPFLHITVCITATRHEYICIIYFQVFTTAFPNLWSGIWVTRVVYWNPEGVFRCLPIFSLAFACQTSIFLIHFCNVNMYSVVFCCNLNKQFVIE